MYIIQKLINTKETDGSTMFWKCNEMSIFSLLMAQKTDEFFYKTV